MVSFMRQLVEGGKFGILSIIGAKVFRTTAHHAKCGSK
jgi:hypothetical protein